jgi:hypothetical protein
LAVNHDEGVQRTGAHRSKNILPLAQRLLDLLAPGYVEHDGPNAGHHTPGVPNQRFVNLERQVTAVTANVVARERSERLLPRQLPLEGFPAFRWRASRNEFKDGTAQHRAGFNSQKLAFGLIDPTHVPLLVQLVVGYRPLLEEVPESLLALDQLGQSPAQTEAVELLSQRKRQVAQTRKTAFLLCRRMLGRFFSRALRNGLRHRYSSSSPQVCGCPESIRARCAALVQARL